MKTPLLLLLLLLSTVTRTVLCQTEDPETETTNSDHDVTPTHPEESEDTPDLGSGQGRMSTRDYTSEPTGTPTDTGPTTTPENEEGLNPVIILIPVVLVVLIISMIVCCIFINRRWNTQVKTQELQKEDPYLDGSSTEKVPMPMFEEDVPSVLELEMEELDKWMKKDG